MSSLATKWPVNELRLTWALFTLDNTFITLVPGVLFTTSMWAVSGQPGSTFTGTVARSAVYFFLYGYFFCLSNQLAGLTEDRLNKPHRPLVRGLLTPTGMAWRTVAAGTAFAVVGWWLGVLEWAALWIVATLLHNQLGWSRNWIFKNTTMWLGITSMLAAGAQQAHALDATAWRWILIIASANFVLVSLQDLRDIAGDDAAGRRTFPLVFGVRRTRVMLCAGFVGYPILLHYAIIAPAGFATSAAIFDIIILSLSLAIAFRVVVTTSPRADHWTYVIYCFQYCVILSAPGISTAG